MNTLEPKYTLDEFAELMKKTKWHLIRVDEEIQKVEYGSLEVKLEIRAGAVEKVVFTTSKAELRPKDNSLGKKTLDG